MNLAVNKPFKEKVAEACTAYLSKHTLHPKRILVKENVYTKVILELIDESSFLPGVPGPGGLPASLWGMPIESIPGSCPCGGDVMSDLHKRQCLAYLVHGPTEGVYIE